MSGWALATTENTDNSTNLSVDLSTGDLGKSEKNMVAGGDLNFDGLSEDLASQIFGVVQDAYKGAQNFVERAIGNNNTQSQNAIQTYSQSLKDAYNSEQATLNNFKTYALYAVVAFIAWAYLKR